KLVFLSPVFPTESHPGARTLGPVRFGLMTRDANMRVAALGSMTERRYRCMKALHASGWGAIGAWSG
ncbi:MAG: thiamine phosphate synthase, partial [Pacificimonas sp.]